MPPAQVSSRRLFFRVAIAVALFLALCATNRLLTILEDETAIIEAANAPAASTVKLFLTGEGQHEHPPLSDLVLHAWLPVAGVSPTLLRVPSVLFYTLALWTLAAIAQRIAGIAAFETTFLLGAFSPFGFHFGRMAGWYSFCLLLISLLTLFYLRFLEAPGWKRFAPVLAFAYTCVTTNYFAWVIVGLIGLDLIISMPNGTWRKYLFTGAAILVLCYGPIWVTFLDEVRGHAHIAGAGHSGKGKLLLALFDLYSLFVSESIAPWFFWISIPLAIAVACSMISTWLLDSGPARRFYTGFCLLFVLMLSIDVTETKRLLFISGWLLVAIGCALANTERPALRGVLFVSLTVIGIAGWFGIANRKYYSALHFVEPWEQLSGNAVGQIERGHTVVSNSPSFLFYLNTAMYRAGLSTDRRPTYASGHGVVPLLSSGPPSSFSGPVDFVKGVNNFPDAVERTVRTDAWLASHCQMQSVENLAPESGFELKQKYFHAYAGDRYRIVIEHFNCGPSS